MMDRCRWIHDPDIGWWHLPGCWGAVHAGPGGCMCDKPGKPADGLEDLYERVRALERIVSEINHSRREQDGAGHA